MPQVRHCARSGTSQKILRQMLQTKAVSTTSRWQKQAARKSTESMEGVTRAPRASTSARKPNMRYDSRPRGLAAAERKMPPVIKAACCRKVGAS